MPTPPNCRRLITQIELKNKFKNRAESAVTPSALFFPYSENARRFVTGIGANLINNTKMKTLEFKICDKTNFIQELGTVESKMQLINNLPLLGFEPCLRKESTHYAVANLPESDKIEFTIWLRKLK